MSFLEYDATRHTWRRNFLKQIDQLPDWNSIEKAIAVYSYRRGMQQASGLFDVMVFQYPADGSRCAIFLFYAENR